MQERALRFMYEDHTRLCDFVLEKTKMPSLRVRRLRTMAIETFNVINKLAPVYVLLHTEQLIFEIIYRRK